MPMITHRDLVAFAGDRVNLKKVEADGCRPRELARQARDIARRHPWLPGLAPHRRRQTRNQPSRAADGEYRTLRIRAALRSGVGSHCGENYSCPAAIRATLVRSVWI